MTQSTAELSVKKKFLVKTYRATHVNQCVAEDIKSSRQSFLLLNAIFVFFQCNINLYLLYRQTIHYLNILISLGTALPSNTTGGPSILNYFWFTISFPLFFTLEIPILTSSSSRYFLLTFTRQLKQQLLREDFHSLFLNRYAMPTN